MTAIVTRLLAPGRRHGRLGEHRSCVHQIWDNQVRASVSIPPTAAVSGLHVPHLPQAAHHVPRSRRVGLADRRRRPTSWWRCGWPRPARVVVRRAGLRQVDARGGVARRRRRRRRTCGSCRSTGSCPPTSTPAASWMAGPAGKTMRDLTAAAAQLQPAPGGASRKRLGAEAFELIRAANSGCGFITTVHSLSAHRGDEHAWRSPRKMGAQSESAAELRRTFARLIDVVVLLRGDPAAPRRRAGPAASGDGDLHRARRS